MNNRSLIASIAAAIRPGWTPEAVHEDMPAFSETENATAPEGALSFEGTSSMTTQNLSGAGLGAEAIAALAAAGDTGRSEGNQAAMARVTSVLGADGIKGDGIRMAAALDLLAGSPDMKAEAIVGFVTANVSAGKPAASTETPAPQPSGGTPQQQIYETERLAAGGLMQPQANGGQPKESGLSRAVSAHIATLTR